MTDKSTWLDKRIKHIEALANPTDSQQRLLFLHGQSELTDEEKSELKSLSYTERSAEWLENKVQYIKGLKKPTDEQKLLVLLFELEERSKEDQNDLDALIKAERASEKALKARAEAVERVKAKKDEKRKERTHQLCNSAGLMIMAGLVDTKTGKPLIDAGELLGALMGLAQVPPDDERRVVWKQSGDALIAESNKKDSNDKD